jgi:hypothetical protein
MEESEEDNADKAFNETLKRMLQTPPKPHKGEPPRPKSSSDEEPSPTYHKPERQA